MFRCYEKSTGTRFPKIVALLVLAFVFTPAVLFVSRPIASPLVFLSILFSSICATAAWVNWRTYSRLSLAPISTLKFRS